ncbi:molybdenum cofactor guanylyltransferase [Paenalcaligenes hominis]|uniref:molybdenum cofactor guanylyltransferase n=1 Tax=Paenalcaligenes hominis TaxID=643674 RepID=UPI0035249CCF
MPKKELTGAILTGGQARRLQELGSIDKGLVELQGKPLVAWVHHCLTAFCQSPLLISANRNQADYATYGTVVADPAMLEPYQGPLAGLWALLEQCETEWLMVLPVDTPFIRPPLLQTLWDARLAEPKRTLFYMQHERSYPLCLLAHRSSLAILKADVLAGERRVQGWLQKHQAVAVTMQQYAASHFFNINTPADIQSAQLRALDMKVD